MNNQVHPRIVREVAEEYSDYEVVAMDEGYPGIFEEPVLDHELLGRTDLILSQQDQPQKLKVVETGSVSSLKPEGVERKYIENAQQIQKHIDYFEGLDYEVDPEVELKPRGELGALKRIWEDTSGVFTWNQARDVIDNDDILSRFKNDGVIIFDSVSNTGSELYSVNEEKDEYEELIDLFYREII